MRVTSSPSVLLVIGHGRQRYIQVESADGLFSAGLIGQKGGVVVAVTVLSKVRVRVASSPSV